MLCKATRPLFSSLNKQIHIIKHAQSFTTTFKPQHIEEYQAKLIERILDLQPTNNESQSYALPERPGSFALCDHTKFDADTYLFAFETGPAFYNISSSKKIGDRIFEFEPGTASRTNDGRVDKQGRFVFGGMDDPMDANMPRFESGVYRINKDLSHTKILNENIACSNSICFSNDGKTMYFSDSLGAYDKASIFRYDYFEHDKAPRNRQIFGVFDKSNAKLKINADESCFVDGSIVDNEDCVWNAGCGSSRVWRFNKYGNIDKVVHVPEAYVTCATFGGKDLDIMYITTLTIGHALTGIEKGALYAVQLPVKGCQEDVFLGHCV